MAKIKAHECETSYLLKLNCKINHEIVGCLLDLKVTNLFPISQAVEWLTIKTTLVANPITV
jgi:hypothetical protein